MIYSDKEFIGKTIQNIRKRANIKQNELAEKIGISEKHLSKIETGKNLPSLDNFLKMAEVLKFSLDDFGGSSRVDSNTAFPMLGSALIPLSEQTKNGQKTEKEELETLDELTRRFAEKAEKKTLS